jgi:hypothetical protein
MSFIGAFLLGIRLPSGVITAHPAAARRRGLRFLGALPDFGKLKHVIVIEFNR